MTPYQELLCDNRVSRFFVEACALPEPRYEPWLFNALYDWQTLVAGVGAFIGAWLLWRQIEDQREQFRQEQQRAKLKARIQLPHALGRLHEYWKACFKAWKAKDPGRRPVAPSLDLQTVIDAAVLVDKETFESFKQLITLSQAFEARISDKDDRPSNFYDMMLVDIARLLYLTNRLFDYGRLRIDSVPYQAPTREDLDRELAKDTSIWRLSVNEGDPTHERIQNALKTVPQNNQVAPALPS